jgi:hypothetical protein
VRYDRDDDRLIRALADFVVSAHENQWALLTWWIEAGEPLLERCSCRTVNGTEQCVCRVEFEADPRWTCIARTRVLAKRHPGQTPSQRCPLCRAGDHLWAPTHEVTMSVTGNTSNWLERFPEYGAHTRRVHRQRAARADCYPPGSADEQLRLALERSKR